MPIVDGPYLIKIVEFSQVHFTRNHSDISLELIKEIKDNISYSTNNKNVSNLPPTPIIAGRRGNIPNIMPRSISEVRDNSAYQRLRQYFSRNSLDRNREELSYNRETPATYVPRKASRESMVN